MRRLVLCCDGTWNTADRRQDGVPTPTNVRLIHNALEQNERQLARYFSGVGTQGNVLSRAIAAGIGLGLSRNIMNAYLWLAETFRPGDELVLFGFSRGAYTVRSLVGMLTCCGLVRFDDSDPRQRWDTVRRIFDEGYRKRRTEWRADATFQPGFAPDDPAPIAFVGVWDTVGSLGIPKEFGLMDKIFNRQKYRFHDVDLAADVRHARHAVALDERRRPFAPTLWNEPEPEPGRTFKQVWFPGVHSDVGGGYPETGLSYGALRWMAAEVDDTVKLTWRADAFDRIEPDPFDVLHDSCSGIYRRLGPRPRATPCVEDRRDDVHDSARTRVGSPPLSEDPYRQQSCFTPEGSATVTVYSHLPWSETGLFLPKGKYRIDAAGQWLDNDVLAGPDGVRSYPPSCWFRYALGASLSGLRSAIRFITRTRQADVPGAKRVPGARRMQLISVVANGHIADDGGLQPHQTVPFAPDQVITVDKPGYLYAFANDCWARYETNRGQLTLTVTRV